MPKSTRDWAKRELDGAKNNIDWVGTHIMRVVTVYQDAHPEIADPLHNALEVLEMVDNIVTHIRNTI